MYQQKRMFLIRLLKALGYGSVIAYSICSCDKTSTVPDPPPQKSDSATDSNTITAPGEAQNADSAAAPQSDPAPGEAQNVDNAATPNAKPVSDDDEDDLQMFKPQSRPTRYLAR